MKPYAWIPTLYFAEAVPYAAVMTLSVIMYTNLNLSNTEVALYTSWLYLPWVIKPFWSPLVDQWRTKRWWILSMQVLVGSALAGVALTLPMAMWLRASLAFFWLMAFSSATHDIAADGFYIISLSKEDQAFYVGIRSTFYRFGTLFCSGFIVLFVGALQEGYFLIPYILYPRVQYFVINVPKQDLLHSWIFGYALLAILFLIFALYHSIKLPNIEKKSAIVQGIKAVGESFSLTIKAFFSKPHIWAALLFMLLFRLPEAQLAKMAQPFMLRPLAEGGLELGTATVGFAYGTLGVIGLLAGGIIGGWVVSKHGLRRWLWPMVIAISIPDVVYIYLAYAQPSSLWIINACVFIEQFGYGFGFTAYMLFLVYFSRGERSTSVFALCTAFQALGMMLPGMVAGWLADTMGFCHFFIFVCLCTLVTFVVSGLIRRDLK
ncbi:MAG: MFS transporter [Bacteroidaceae bacterium]|nr:MFS transporter [Bacteroidaceae bacterium]